jgi:catechol 2,3-dioxygenase-like lactoylglutathione lyase family enzyme
MRLHHVQVCCPPGGEAEARRFYRDGLGLVEVPKPPGLAGRGGCWFRSYDAEGRVAAEIHVGVEDPFVPGRKAHPALVVDDTDELDRLVARLRAAGHPVDESEGDTFAGHRRVHTADPHGNRVEVLAPAGRPPRVRTASR